VKDEPGLFYGSLKTLETVIRGIQGSKGLNLPFVSNKEFTLFWLYRSKKKFTGWT